MGKIVDILKTGKVLVSDGAWGTFLYEKGLKAGECPEAMSIDCFEDVMSIAVSYLDSGADIVMTNSLGANRYRLSCFGLQDKVAEINERAAVISRKAAGEKFVVASVGPTGKMLVTGEVTEEDLYEAFKTQVVALEKGGADAICVETMSDADEACCAVKAAIENTKLEVIATFTFNKTVHGTYRSMMGLSPEDAARTALGAGAHITGTNCGCGIEYMIDVVKEMKTAVPDAFILAQPNAGLPSRVDGRDVFPEAPEKTASHVKSLIRAGANIVGGCCGTTPAHIAAIRKVVDEHNKT